MRADADLTDWVIGARRAPGGRRVAVIEEPGTLMLLRSSGWVDAATRVFLHTKDGHLAPAAVRSVPLLSGYRGSFARPGTRIEFDDGYVLERTSYGDAEFRAIEMPTEVRVWCSEDLSAFLRDADLALATGEFPGYLTNPLTILADQPALTGRADEVGGAGDRIFVAAGGRVAVSPTGPTIGRVQDDPARWITAGERIEAQAPVPGSVALGGVLDDADRRDALADRPSLPRFLRAVRAQQTARARGRLISRISGFGGRFSPGLPAGIVTEPTGYPLLARAGSQQWIITGLGDAALATPEQVGVLEVEACLPDPRERRDWAFRQLGITAARYRELRAALLPAAQAPAPQPAPAPQDTPTPQPARPASSGAVPLPAAGGRRAAR